ncbi:hypothetical protein OKW21_002847 [Catalinimonas alkaloidigena]|uniref:hypothetical protein n=1 Tax=Catalinimonas alkaloidigena TaxID=1075417 RepID=UPI002406F639|nr:hypothetical protein [Catalinimonas alkaloidigena]MDF9797584.1 hypothetical protein [Catalinimonas alkaloidigena]
MLIQRLFLILLCYFTLQTAMGADTLPLIFCGSPDNDLYMLLEKEGASMIRYNHPATAIAAAPSGSAVFLIADGYPETKNELTPALLQTAREKKLKIYLEYPAQLPGFELPQQPVATQLERGIVSSEVFGSSLPPMTILGVNDCHVLPIKVSDPLIVLGKVAGLDKAVYGIDDIQTYPLLFKQEEMWVAMTQLSNFVKGRFAPHAAWKQVWRTILTQMTGKNLIPDEDWPSEVSPMYGKDEKLPQQAKEHSIAKGVEWFFNGRFFVHPSWKEMWLQYQGDGTAPFGPPVSQNLPNGDGSLGLLEGHASKIYHDGSQQYRYWIRADVQGEGAYALAAAGKLLNHPTYHAYARELINYIFEGSNLRAEARDEKGSASYGLIGWSVTHPWVFYGDDNARTILGIMGASAYMDTNEWDQELAEAILANFRTTGKQGFRGSRLEEKDLQQYGWKHFWQRDITNPAPHFESWMWACYLWLYDKSGYEPLLAKTKAAIGEMMERYPEGWHWTNGIQQERARMILPLAWLVRVEDTPLHRQWLDRIVSKLLENQVASGAIREELGAGKGKYGRTASNQEYGLHEAPLIFENGDPVADMLYTSNFAFFSLNEAAHATGNPEYRQAVAKLSDFLTRIQVKSNTHNDLDGAWFRAFEFDRWEYWASNADAGWGAWGTLSGWTQSWIVSTQALTVREQSFWELTRASEINAHMPETLELMFEGSAPPSYR